VKASHRYIGRTVGSCCWDSELLSAPLSRYQTPYPKGEGESGTVTLAYVAICSPWNFRGSNSLADRDDLSRFFSPNMLSGISEEVHQLC